jgi:hypothetical protein
VNVTQDIANKILSSCLDYSKLDILFSLKAFLLNKSNCPFFVHKNGENIDCLISSLHSRDLNFYKAYNEKNLRKIKISPNSFQCIPKNRCMGLLHLVDELINNLSQDEILIFDNLRINPFLEDCLFNFLKQNNASGEIYNLYLKRSLISKDLDKFFLIENNVHESCLDKALKIKLIDYWRNSYGLANFYNENLLIENLILK